MSFILTTRLITRGYRSQALSFNFNVLNLKTCKGKNFCEAAAPLIQKRRLCDKNEIGTKTDDNLEKIYFGTLSTKIKAVKIFSLSTSMLSLIVQPYLFPKLVATGTIAAPIIAGLGICVFTFGTPLLFHMLTSKYVVDIHYNTKTKSYIATVFSIFARKKKIEFTPNDVAQPELGQMMTNCIIKGRALLIDFTNFNDPHHYALIMGYDKPMSFRIEEDIGDKKDTQPKSFEFQADPDRITEKKSARN